MSLIDDVRKVAGLVSKQGEVFQHHVIDLVSDLIADSQFHKEFIVHHYENTELHDGITNFKNAELEGLPYEPSASAWIEPLLAALDGGAAQTNAGEILDVVIGEIVHRRKWDEVMDKHPDTLTALRASVRGHSS